MTLQIHLYLSIKKLTKNAPSVKEMFEAYLTVAPKLSKEVISKIFLSESVPSSF